MKTRRSLPSVLASRVVVTCLVLIPWLLPCRAHDDTQTHARLSVGSLLFLDQTFPEDGALFALQYRDMIRWGSVNEDGTNLTDTVFRHHFYNPKTGGAFSGSVLTAPQRSTNFWRLALQHYRANQVGVAFEELGHVLHLLQDMTSPAHVHLDNHGQVNLGHCEGDGDDFEVWGYCDDLGINAIVQYISSTNVHASTIRPRLATGLQSIFNNQPQRPAARPGDFNTAYTFVRGLATNVYDFTTFKVVLRDTFNANDQGAGELAQMFPSLEETTVPAAWWIGEVGYSEGECVYTTQPAFNESWWIMPGCNQYYENFGTVYVVEGEVYIENIGGGSGGSFGVPETLIPDRYNRTWFTRRYGSVLNSSRTPMIRIYGDVLYPAAVAYGAGLLQAFLDEAIMPKPITDKPTQVTGISAQLNGRVHPAGVTASAWFEWGTNGSYWVTTQMTPAGAGQILTNIYGRIDGLTPDTVYQYRIVSSNQFGIRHGTNQTFRTPTLLVTGNTPNAWQITDRSDGSFLHYFRNLSTPLQQAANNGWRYSVKARMVDDFNDTMTMTFLYGMTATKRFLVWWDLDSSGNLTAQVEGRSTRVIATNGLGATLYHTHEILYTNGAASYLFDGAVIETGLLGVDAGATLGGEIAWGSGSSAGQGQMNFQELEFEIAGSGVVASYHAGTSGAAPNPVNQGWTANPVSPTLPNAFTPVSPDFEPYLPLVETLPASEVGLTEGRLNGRGDPRGESAMGWFEWGTSTTYGNVTLPLDLGDGFGWRNLNKHLTGLAAGQTYHFRLVVGNAFATVFGDDHALVATQPVTIVATEVPQAGQFRLRFTGVAGAAYEVLRSSDLSTWSPVGEGVESSAGVFEFLDTDAPTGNGYYRVRSVVP